MYYALILLLMLTTCKTEILKPSYGNSIPEMEVRYLQLQAMTGREVSQVWDRILFKCRYKLGATGPDFYDCGTGLWTVLRHLGAVHELMNVEALFKKLGKKRKKLKEVETGDIIIWKSVKPKSGKTVRHVGMVVDKNLSSGMIRYRDVNVKDNGSGDNWVSFYSSKLDGEYNMPKCLFMGFN
jgi:hypothetical protein